MTDARRDRIESWVADFCGGDALTDRGELREAAGGVLVAFLEAACRRRDVEPGDVEEEDIGPALLEHVARLAVPDDARSGVPALCGDLLGWLETEGRLSGGRALGTFVRALGPRYLERSAGKGTPDRRPGTKLGRNDPCPCGSGNKYKKCCMNL